MARRPLNPYQCADLLIRPQDPYANAKYQIILELLSKNEVKSILNAGCGSGEFSFLLAQKGYRIWGIDPVKEHIKLAKEGSQKLSVKNCYFSVSSIEDYHPQRLFDVVIATDVLEHIKNDKKAIDKLSSLVRPKGLLIITVPAGRWLFGYHDEKLGHFRRYSKKSFKKLLPEEIQIKLFRYFGFSLIPVCLLYSKILKKPYPVAQSADKNKNPIVSNLLTLILKLEKQISLPWGTSLIFLGEKV